MKKTLFLLLLVIGVYQNAHAQALGYVGEIRLFAGTFAPIGWAFCDGKELTIKENSTLYAVLGNKYGGNGSTTFALPNLCRRVPIGVEPDELGKKTIPNFNPTSAGGVNATPVIVQRVTPPCTALYYIICVEGIFPTRK